MSPAFCRAHTFFKPEFSENSENLIKSFDEIIKFFDEIIK